MTGVDGHTVTFRSVPSGVGHIKEKISEMIIHATLIRASLEAAITNCKQGAHGEEDAGHDPRRAPPARRGDVIDAHPAVIVERRRQGTIRRSLEDQRPLPREGLLQEPGSSRYRVGRNL